MNQTSSRNGRGSLAWRDYGRGSVVPSKQTVSFDIQMISSTLNQHGSLLKPMIWKSIPRESRMNFHPEIIARIGCSCSTCFGASRHIMNMVMMTAMKVRPQMPNSEADCRQPSEATARLQESRVPWWESAAVLRALRRSSSRVSCPTYRAARGPR